MRISVRASVYRGLLYNDCIKETSKVNKNVMNYERSNSNMKDFFVIFWYKSLKKCSAFPGFGTRGTIV